MSPRVEEAVGVVSEVAPRAVDSMKCVRAQCSWCVPAHVSFSLCPGPAAYGGMWSWEGCIVTSEHH